MTKQSTLTQKGFKEGLGADKVVLVSQLGIMCSEKRATGQMAR